MITMVCLMMENYLNRFLEESNELFVKLLEIEDLCQ